MPLNILHLQRVEKRDFYKMSKKEMPNCYDRREHDRRCGKDQCPIKNSCGFYNKEMIIE
jgi:hypothetical protein